jgi:CcmD family protein
MNRSIAKFCTATVLLFYSFSVQAQAAAATDDIMRSNGKIYVVMAVCLTILIGLFAYVFSIDRKITKLEKEK